MMSSLLAIKHSKEPIMTLYTVELMDLPFSSMSSLMEELIGSLMTYEINLTKKLQEGEDKKKKSITLKATTKKEEDVEEEKPSDEDDDLALITRKLNKYMRGERFT